MIFVIYLCTAFGVVFLSIKAANYVDWIDKKTKLSGAFIGGIMLSAVTSLPELFTSLSATLMLDQPGLCIGNVLGSDLFNIMILALLIMITFREFSKADISKNHLIVIVTIMISYFAIVLNFFGIADFEIIKISSISIIIAACYAISFKYLAGEEGDTDESSDDITLSLKQIVVRFIIVSIGIIVLSIMISYITDNISDRYQLGKGIAGALFMGVATSLPEVTSSITLFRKKNYDIAVGNIIGSNIFNLAILALADIVYLKGGVYDFTDPKTVNLMICGAIATPLLWLAIKVKNKPVKIISLIGIVLCYVGFLVL